MKVSKSDRSKTRGLNSRQKRVVLACNDPEITYYIRNYKSMNLKMLRISGFGGYVVGYPYTGEDPIAYDQHKPLQWTDDKLVFPTKKIAEEFAALIEVPFEYD
ncbi:hypothetical protein YerA41_023 [Yersinia phage YerA41]|nr:hypothetical protein YerA41_023 [Yersinia phage YerA41]